MCRKESGEQDDGERPGFADECDEAITAEAGERLSWYFIRWVGEGGVFLVL